MNQVEDIFLARRSISRAAALSAAGASAFSRARLGAETGIVPAMVNAAANATIKAHPLRRNISVLEGPGGKIAVLSGSDGRLLVDAGFRVSRPELADALATVNASPVKHLINTHWHTASTWRLC